MQVTERSDGTYSALKQMIISNELGPGERLLDRELADKVGVSRTPVRDALRRLEQDGLITTRTGRRWFVADLDTKQAANLYELREVLEVRAVHWRRSGAPQRTSKSWHGFCDVGDLSRGPR